MKESVYMYACMCVNITNIQIYYSNKNTSTYGMPTLNKVCIIYSNILTIIPSQITTKKKKVKRKEKILKWK